MDQLEIECKPSWQHFLILVAVHGLSLIGLMMSALSVTLQLALTLAVVTSLVHFSRLVILVDPLAIKRLKARPQRWELTLVNGEKKIVKQTGEIVVWPWLVVARFKDSDYAYPLVLMPDSVSKTDHRRSRIYFTYYS